jgi:formate hydrogenlyase subunit 3/multisubunit Na+/H+ antiporter MnhD subunit
MIRAIGTFALFAIPGIGLAVPVYILVRSYLNFRRAKKGRGHIILRAIGSVAIWLVASFIMFNMLFIVFYTARDVDREANAAAVALRLIIFSVVYALAGCGLIFLSQRRADIDPVEIFPKGAT